MIKGGIIGLVLGLGLTSVMYLGLLIYLVTGDLSEDAQAEESVKCMTQIEGE